MKGEKSIKTDALLSAKSEYIERIFKDSEYAWEILPKIRAYAEELIFRGIEGYTELYPGVLVGKNVKISKTAVIDPPVVIGSGTEIRPGAYIRGNVIIGENCVIGNSTEVKNSVISDRAQIPHYNYVGDSVLGYRAHLGAGAICSNLKLGGGSVTVTLGEKLDTGLRKFGAILGDLTDVGCNCVLNPGTIIGKNSAVYPLLSLRGVYPEGCIIKSDSCVILKKDT